MDDRVASSVLPNAAAMARKPSTICESPLERMRSPLITFSSGLPSKQHDLQWTAADNPFVQAQESTDHSRRMQQGPDGAYPRFFKDQKPGAEPAASLQPQESASAWARTASGGHRHRAGRLACESPAFDFGRHGPGFDERQMSQPPPAFDLPPVGQVPLIAGNCKSIDPAFLRSTTYPAGTGKNRPGSRHYAYSNRSQTEVHTNSIVECLRQADGTCAKPCGEVWLSKREWLREAATVSHRSHSMYLARPQTDSTAFDFQVAPPRTPDPGWKTTDARALEAAGAPELPQSTGFPVSLKMPDMMPSPSCRDAQTQGLNQRPQPAGLI